MKKRTGVERAVIVMAVVVVLLAIALIVVNAAGIRIHKPAPEAPAATNLPQFPFSDEPELILGSGQAPSRDAQQAVDLGAEGIGLCRTEHMFFEGERIKAMREMIVADNPEDRKKALAKIMPYQQGDFEGLYEAMEIGRAHV